MKTHRLARLASFLSLAAAAACSNEPAPVTAQATPAIVRARIQSLVPAISERTDAALGAASTPLDGLMHVLRDLPLPAIRGASPALGTGKAPSVPSSADRAMHRILFDIKRGGGNTGGSIETGEPPITPPQLPQHLPPTRPGVDTAAWLDDTIFSDANFVDGAFNVPAAVVCGDDAACATKIADAHLAVIATPTGRDGLDLELVTGLERTPALTVSLRPEQASFELDLAPLAPVMFAALGDAGDATHGLTLEASGLIDGSMAAWADDDVTAELTIAEPVHLALRPAGARTSDRVLALDVAAASPAVSMHLDGPHHQIVSALQLGRVAVNVPASADAKTPGKLAVIPALSLAAVTRGGHTDVHALSLGGHPATISVHDQVAASLAINPDDGGAVDLAIDTEDDTGAVVVEASPKLDVRVSMDWATLGMEAPASWPTRLVLDAAAGANGAVRLAGDELEVVAGTLSVTTGPNGTVDTYEAGQCVSHGIAVECGSRALD